MILPSMVLPLHYVPLLSFRQPSSQARLPKFFGFPFKPLASVRYIKRM